MSTKIGGAIRLIPARAGNISGGCWPYRRWPAHPRSRGEHFTVEAVAAHFVGSSPLARGTSRARIQHNRHSRLIPARAGNIVSGLFTTGKDSAHPRSRGEHVKLMNLTRGKCGSSPLARGTSRGACVPPRTGRLIPARAGNIYGHYRFRFPVAAHPRSRGEHS